MIAFLDTEFTGLVGEPKLLSIGLVVVGGRKCEFYAEVNDLMVIRAASNFARDIVLPQFGKIEGAACSYIELGRRLYAFFAQLSYSLKSGETMEIAYESDRDRELFGQALRNFGIEQWSSVARAVRPVNVYNIAGFAAGELASIAYFDSQAHAPFARHHALCDARALRIAFDAANAFTEAREGLHNACSTCN